MFLDGPSVTLVPVGGQGCENAEVVFRPSLCCISPDLLQIHTIVLQFRGAGVLAMAHSAYFLLII